MLADGEIESLDAIVCNAGVRLNRPVSYSADGYGAAWRDCLAAKAVAG